MTKKIKTELRIKEMEEQKRQEIIAYNKALFIMSIKDFFTKEGNEYRVYLSGSAVVIITIYDTYAEVLDVMKENDLYYKYDCSRYAKRNATTVIKFETLQ